MRLTSLGYWSLAFWLALPSIGATSDSRDSRLLEAVKKSDVETARALLNEKADVNSPDGDGATPLAWAVYHDNEGLADLLIAAGANVNAANDLGITPLALASTNSNARIAEKLLQHGANPNAASVTKETPLMTASRLGGTEVVRVLLAAGADVKPAESSRGQTALMWAAAEGHSDVVRLLLDAHADVKASSLRGWTPLLFAAGRGDVDCVRLLVSAGARVDSSTPDGTTALMVAASGGAWPEDYQYWTPPKDQSGPSPHEQVGLFLLDKDANPRTYDSIGRTALHWAARTGKLELAKALLSHGAQPNAHMVQNWPQLPGALGDWSRTDFAGATPFLLAAKIPNLTMMRLLVAGGADPNIPAFDRTTPLMLIAGVGRQEGGVTRLVSEDILIPAANYVIELGNDVNAVNLLGYTAAHGAAANGADQVIQLLARKGAKLNVRNQEGETPEDLADQGVSVGATQVVHKKTAELLRKLVASAGQ